MKEAVWQQTAATLNWQQHRLLGSIGSSICPEPAEKGNNNQYPFGSVERSQGLIGRQSTTIRLVGRLAAALFCQPLARQHRSVSCSAASFGQSTAASYGRSLEAAVGPVNDIKANTAR